MWAQLITTRFKPGHEDDLPKLWEKLQAAERPGSGLVRSTAMRDFDGAPEFVDLSVVEETTP